MMQKERKQTKKVIFRSKITENMFFDIFDEKKYYAEGKEAKFIEWNNKKIGLLICEDMWYSTLHDVNPVQNLKDLNQELDLVVNLSASPYNLYKTENFFHRKIQKMALYQG